MRRKIGLAAAVLFVCMVFNPLAAQEITTDTIKNTVVSEKDTLIFVIVEEMPEFPGGIEAMNQFIRENLRWPIRDADIEGRVFVGFVVEKDGSLTNFEIIRGVAPVLDDEALRVVKLMPNWKAGKQRGKEVRVQYIVPVNFTLN